MAMISVAAPTMYPLEALPGDVYARDGEKLAELAREDPVAAGTIEEGAPAPNDAWPSVLSPGEQLEVLEGFVGGYCIQLHSLGRASLADFLIPGPGGATSLRSRSSRTTWLECGWWAKPCRMRATGSRLKRDVRDRFGLRVPNVHFNDHQRYLAMHEHPYVRGRVGLRRRDATRTFRVRAISHSSQPRYRSHERAARGRHRKRVRPRA